MKNLKLAVCSILLAAGTVACGGNGGSTDDNGDNGSNGDNGTGGTSVSVVDSAFNPETLDVSVGDTVTWTWEGTQQPHNVHASDESFSSGTPVAEDGTTFSHTFDEAGTYDYVCQVHQDEMTGTINVS